MQVNTEQLINWVLANGEDYGVSFKDIEFVGVDSVMRHINAQVDAVTLMPHTDPNKAMNDFFAESFGHLYDIAWSGR